MESIFTILLIYLFLFKIQNLSQGRIVICLEIKLNLVLNLSYFGN